MKKKARRQRIIFIGSIVLAITALIVLMLVLGKSEKVEISEIQEPALVTENEIPTEIEIPKPKTFQYIEIVNACDWTGVGACVNMRSGPGIQHEVVERLRNGVVLEVGESVEVDGLIWYKVLFSSWLRYPERVEGDLYVAGTDSVELFTDIGDQNAGRQNTSSTKRIVVDISEQMLYAYDGDTIFMQEVVSTGLEATPTPQGKFFVFRKTPSRYMQGPIPGVSDQEYDLPGVPWDLYFTAGGAVIHGAYWHDNYGQVWSHGCVNMSVDKARKLYEWADLGIPVVVQN